MPGLLEVPKELYDPRREFHVLLPLKSKRGRADFILNPMQEDYLARKSYRNIIVKGRQMGFSTVELAHNLLLLYYLRNRNLVIAAYRDSLARAMLMQIRKWIEDWPGKHRPILTSATTERLTIGRTASGYPINCSVWIVSAKGDDPGRGEPIHILHGTEVAYWPDGGEVMAGLVSSVPDPPWGIVTLESTPNGASGTFYQTYVDAKAAKNSDIFDEPFTPFFYPWYIVPEYTDEHYTEAFVRSLNSEELALRDKHGLTLGQLFWRRRKMRELSRNGKFFKQEFPEDDISCFIVQGSAVFDADTTATLTEYIEEPRNYSLMQSQPRVIEECGPDLRVWREPIKGEKYEIGADSSEGVGQDAHAAVVINRKNGEHVATLRSNRMNPDVFGQKLDMLGRWYFDARIAVERKSTGIVVIRALERLRYPSLYRHVELRHGNVSVADEAGWPTTGQTKPEMIGNMQEALRTGSFFTHSATLINEIRTYVYAPHGAKLVAEAAPKAYDDELMAAMIAEQLRRLPPLRTAGEFAPPLRLFR